MLSGGAAAGVVPSLRGVSSPAACCQGLVSPTMDRICSAALRLRALRGSDTGPSVAAVVVGAPPASNVAAAAAGDASPPRRASAGDLFQNVPGTEVVALASSDAGPGSPGARLVAAAIAARGLILVSTVRRCGAPLPSPTQCAARCRGTPTTLSHTFYLLPVPTHCDYSRISRTNPSLQPARRTSPARKTAANTARRAFRRRESSRAVGPCHSRRETPRCHSRTTKLSTSAQTPAYLSTLPLGPSPNCFPRPSCEVTRLHHRGPRDDLARGCG